MERSSTLVAAGNSLMNKAPVPAAKNKLIQKDMTGYLGQQDENEPLAAMDSQLLEMDRDYNVMLMERIESKKQLEAKFQDIQRKIQANRDFTKAETKRVNDTLKAFRAKFEHKLRVLREKFEAKLTAMRERNRTEFRSAEERLDRLEAAIAQEIDDRVTETDEQIGETQETLTRKWAVTGRACVCRAAGHLRRGGADTHRAREGHLPGGRQQQVQPQVSTLVSAVNEKVINKAVNKVSEEMGEQHA